MLKSVLRNAVTGLLVGAAGTSLVQADESNWVQPISFRPLANAERSTAETTLKLGAVFLDRGRADDIPVVAPLLPGAAPTFSTSDLDVGLGSGFQMELSREFDSGVVFSTSYMGIDSYSTSLQGTGNPASLFPPALPTAIVQGVNGVFPSLTGVSSFNMDYGSELHTIDLNIGRAVNDSITLSGGVRYFYLAEQFAMQANNYPTPIIPLPVGSDQYNNSTYNNLFGLQGKADINIWRNDQISFDTSGFAGIYANHAIATGSASRSGSFLGLADFEGTTSDRTTRSAFLGGLNLSVTNRLTDYAYIQAGYQWMWLSGVALAPDQIDNTNVPAGVGTIDANGNLCYQGGFVNLVLTR